jgi:hypothetical protein
MSTESRRATSVKAASFTESVIREMTRLADLHGAINQGAGIAGPGETRQRSMCAEVLAFDRIPAGRTLG